MEAMVGKWLTVDSMEEKLAYMYSLGRGRLFEMFFGWRKATEDKAYYVLPQSAWDEIRVLKILKLVDE